MEEVAGGPRVFQVARPCMEGVVAAEGLQVLEVRPFMEDQVARRQLEMVLFRVGVGRFHLASAPPAESASPSFKALNLKISNARTL